MAAKPLSESDLTALSDAINDYENSWKPVDRELYGLCRRRPSHHDSADVYTKVAVVGRVYAAGIARAWGRKHDYPPESEIAQNRNKLPEKVVTDLLKGNANLIEDGLGSLTGHQFGPQVAGEIVALHGALTNAIHTRTGLYLTSFVSKYLHFHSDIVPIYDDRARFALYNNRSASTADQAAGRWLTGLHSWVGQYRSFVARFMVLYECYERAFDEAGKSAPTVKELDHMLWWQSTWKS
ncbi:hypothetical protein [Mycobacterium malmoense]|uniref:hypothetical protein n=1 Tax=Mycobacterium malmoense TaxID=1780 RepID=UPI001146EA25|nr:hypothetical protein [Mycobacterium malmoense]